MIIKVNTITHNIDMNFANVYKAQGWFKNSGSLWNECIQTIHNAELMNNIIFCNNIMEIPPVKTFLKSNFNITIVSGVKEKQALGAFWGFIFKNVFECSGQIEGIPVRTKGVKKATRFISSENKIKIEQ